MTQVRPFARAAQAIEEQQGRLFLWVPVCLAIGIGGYFSLPSEPAASVWLSLIFLAGLFTALAYWGPAALKPVLLAIVMIAVGASAAKWRVERVAGPVLEFRYYGPIEGRVVMIDRSASDAVRLTLDNVVLEDVATSRTPLRVRVSLHGTQPLETFKPGERLILTGHLSPPSGPAEPGGFDFQRHAWFDRLGAVGYTRTPVLRANRAENGLGLMVFKVRSNLSEAVRTTVAGEPGAFAAAIMTGDRSAISQDTLSDLRASNLAHLLAISGLHMGLLTGFIFGLLRYGLALVPGIALRFPIKKIAAVTALCVGAFYLALSGMNVATVRAYIMVSVMLVAVLLDRRALSLRSVAIAATLILLLTPEALVGPGFQMSFAATTALVATYRAMRSLDLYHFPGWSRAILNVVVTSGVAGLATAPIAAAHFNQIAHYGLIANVISVPLMGILVMPAAVFAIVMSPFGLWSAGLWVMEQGLRWILFVAATTAAQPGALSHVKAPDPEVLAIISLGSLLGILWTGRGRLVAIPLVGSAFLLWFQVDRADVLIADNGSLIGVMTEEGRSLSRERGSGFVAGIWLENDGAPVEQRIAAARGGMTTEDRVTTVTLGDWTIVQVSGKVALADLWDCGGADILISNQTDVGDRTCLALGLTDLRGTGALSLSLDAQGSLGVTTARELSGNRPWNRSSQPLELPELLTKTADGTVLASR